MAELNTDWLFYAEQNTGKPVFLVTITKGSNVYYFASSDRRLSFTDLSEPVELCVEHVGDLTQEINPLQPKFQVRECSVVFLVTEHTKDVFSGERLRGAAIKVEIGWQEQTLAANFVDYFDGVVESAETVVDAGALVGIAVAARTAELFPRDAVGTSRFSSKHPHQIMESLATQGGMPSGRVDSSSLDPDNYTDISHLNTVRASHGPDDRSINEPENILGLMEEVAALVPGAYFIDEAGKFGYHHYDPSAAVVDTWTDEKDAIFFQDDLVGDKLFNRVVLRFGYNGKGQKATFTKEQLDAAGGKYFDDSGEYRNRFEANDATSQAAHAYPGEAEYINPWEEATKWVGPEALLQDDISDSDTEMTLIGGHVNSFCGVDRGDGATEYDLADGRVAYFLIRSYDRFSSVAKVEIVKCTAITLGTAEEVVENQNWKNTYENDELRTETYNYLTCTITRAQLDTTATTHNSSDEEGVIVPTIVYDITIPVLKAQHFLNRWSNGLARMRAQTSLAKHGVGLADFVLPVTDQFIGYGRKGNTSLKFQVVRKTVRGMDGVIDWELLEVPGTVTLDWISDVGDVFSDFDDWFGGYDIDPHVLDGMLIEQVSGLNGTIHSGAIGAKTSRFRRFPVDTNITFTASKDTYLIYDMWAHTFSVREVANNDPVPAFSEHWQLYLGKVVTDGSGITAVTQPPGRVVGQRGDLIKGWVGPSLSARPDPADFAPGQYFNIGDKIFRRREKTLTEYWLAPVDTNGRAAQILWNIDESSGTTATDESGNGRDGTYIGTPTLNQAPLVPDAGKSALFNRAGGPAGSAEVIEYNFADVSGIQAIAVSMWVKFAPGASAQNMFFEIQNQAKSSVKFAAGLTSSGGLELTFNGSVTTDTKTDYRTFFNNNKTLVTVAWDRTTGTMYFWIGSHRIHQQSFADATLTIGNIWIAGESIGGTPGNGLSAAAYIDQTVLLWDAASDLSIINQTTLQAALDIAQREDTAFEALVSDAGIKPFGLMVMSADQSNGTGWNDIDVDLVLEDTHGGMFPVTTSTPGKYVVQKAGWYRARARANVASIPVDSGRALLGISINKGGGGFPSNPQWWGDYSPTASGETSTGCFVESPAVWLDEGDEIKPQVNCNDSTNTIDAQTSGAYLTWFEVEMITDLRELL